MSILFNYNPYVGKILVQYPDEPTPVEAGLAGIWEDWSDRAVLYGVSQTPPPSFVDYYTKVGTSIASGAVPVVCYHKAGSDYQLYRFIAQTDAYIVPEELDPVKWAYLEPGIIDTRQKCGNTLTDDDYEIGDQIGAGSYQGMYVTEIIVPGGKFWGVEGGNRPTFISGGVQPDTMRNFTGRFGKTSESYALTFTLADGAFEPEGSGAAHTGGGSYSGAPRVKLNPSLVVPTGPENRPVNAAVRIWRRLPDPA
jgi:hypothetical protein